MNRSGSPRSSLCAFFTSTESFDRMGSCTLSKSHRASIGSRTPATTLAPPFCTETHGLPTSKSDATGWRISTFILVFFYRRVIYSSVIRKDTKVLNGQHPACRGLVARCPYGAMAKTAQSVTPSDRRIRATRTTRGGNRTPTTTVLDYRAVPKRSRAPAD